MLVVVKDDWMARTTARLQARDHLSCVERVAILIRVSRDHHDSGIRYVVTHAMIRRVAPEHRKVVWILRSSKFIHPFHGTVEKVVPQHVQEWSVEQSGPEQFRSLRQRCPYQQTRIGASEDSDPLGI